MRVGRPRCRRGRRAPRRAPTAATRGCCGGAARCPSRGDRRGRRRRYGRRPRAPPTMRNIVVWPPEVSLGGTRDPARWSAARPAHAARGRAATQPAVGDLGGGRGPRGVGAGAFARAARCAAAARVRSRAETPAAPSRAQQPAGLAQALGHGRMARHGRLKGTSARRGGFRVRQDGPPGSVGFGHGRAAGDRARAPGGGPCRAPAAVRCARGRLPGPLRRPSPALTAPSRGVLAIGHADLPLVGRPRPPRACRSWRCTATARADCRSRGASALANAPGVDRAPARRRPPRPARRAAARAGARRRGPGRGGHRRRRGRCVGGPGARAPRARRAARARRPTSPSTRCSRQRAARRRSRSSTSCAPSRRAPAGARRRCARRSTSTIPTCAGAATASSTTGELLAHADAHGYHVAMAMIPLDAGRPHRADRRALRAAPRSPLAGLPRQRPRQGRAAWRPRDAAGARRRGGPGLRRIERFERRSGLRVDRVMTPPHGMCSEAHDARARRRGLRRAGGDLPAAVDRSLPGRRRCSPAGARRTGSSRLRGHPADPD